MSTRIYIENLPAATSAAELIRLFSTYGKVVDANVAADRNSLQPPGSGFVTMVTSEGARAAIQGLNGKQMASRQIIVTEVCPPKVAPAGAHGPPKYHPALPILKKNVIIPRASSPDGGNAK